MDAEQKFRDEVLADPSRYEYYGAHELKDGTIIALAPFMFTWGLVRSNFSLAMILPPGPLVGRRPPGKKSGDGITRP